MFKYGTVRLFFIKFSLGLILTLFGLVYIGSLVSHSPNDPGFNTFSNSSTGLEVQNYFGLFGSYLSSYAIILIGVISYIIVPFIRDIFFNLEFYNISTFLEVGSIRLIISLLFIFIFPWKLAELLLVFVILLINPTVIPAGELV